MFVLFATVVFKKDQLFYSKMIFCNRAMKKKFIPCQAVSNKLVSRTILFKKVVIMPKGKLPKIKGSLCNTTVNKVYDHCH